MNKQTVNYYNADTRNIMTSGEPTYTQAEAIKTVKAWAAEYNEQTDTPMFIDHFKASNNIDTIEAVEINSEAWMTGKDENLLFRVLWS